MKKLLIFAVGFLLGIGITTIGEDFDSLTLADADVLTDIAFWYGNASGYGSAWYVAEGNRAKACSSVKDLLKKYVTDSVNDRVNSDELKFLSAVTRVKFHTMMHAGFDAVGLDCRKWLD